MADEEGRRKELLVPLLSVLLGVLSVAALLRLAAGVPAIAFGIAGLRRLNALSGRDSLTLLWGKRLAIGGMVLGAAGCLMGVIALASLGLLRVGEASRKTTCADNLRRLGMAVHAHHELVAVYPRAVVEQGPQPVSILAPWLGGAYSSRLSWMVTVLPFLEQPMARKKGQFFALFEKFDREKRWDDPVNRAGINTSMRQFLCGSHPDFDPQHRPALTYYVGISGLGVDAVELPRRSPRAGFFGYERRLTRKELVRGESHTLLATETTIDNGAWAAGGHATVRGLDPQRPFGGLHPGGANLLLADGSVQFFTTTGSPHVLASQATLAED